MFTLLDWILLGVVFICMMFVLVGMHYTECEAKEKIIVLIIEVILMIALIGGCAIYNTRTESGKRHIKSWKSETTGGIDRTVTVFDIKGEEGSPEKAAPS